MLIDTHPTPTVDHAHAAPQILAAIDLAIKIGAADLAEQAARMLIGLFPDAIAPSVLLGRALVDLGQWRQAIDHFRWVLALHPLDSSAWSGMAAALAVAGRHAEARAALGRAALHDPLDSQVLTPGVVLLPREGLGVSYMRQGHADIARSELAAALAERPERIDIQYYYVEALRRCGALPDALALLNQLPGTALHTLPALLLCAALNPNTASQRSQAARLDLDGQYTRRFFAPLRPPWDLLPPPQIMPGAMLSALAPLIAQLPQLQKQAPVSKHTPSAPETTRESLPGAVREYIATAERLRTRLVTADGSPKPLLSYRDSEQQVHVLLACRTALGRCYGSDGAAVIDKRLRTLAETLRHRGVQAHVWYLDDGETLRCGEQIALKAVPPEPAAIAELLRRAARAFVEQGQELGTVLLIGGSECLPSFRMPNLLPDGDPELVSDLPYAGTDEQDLAPQMVVARLPDAGSMNFLLQQLDRMIARHSGPARGPLARFRPTTAEPMRSARVLASGYAAEAWHEPARAILDSLGQQADLLLSPPLEATRLDAGTLFGSQIAYVNLHGAIGRSSWYGQPDSWSGAATKLPVALRPEQLIGQCASDGLLISEACYGLELDGRSVEQAIPLQALRDGMAACIGSTVTAYGSYATPLIGADLLCERLIVHLASGMPSGLAMRQARSEFAQIMYRRQGHLDDVDRKTLLSFVLYGDPWAAVALPNGQPANQAPGLFNTILRPGRPRSVAPIDERQVPRDVLRNVRAALRKVLPGLEQARLAVTARSDRGLALKGDNPPDLVFSAHEQVQTDDGDTITQTAQITVSHDAIIKVALTR